MFAVYRVIFVVRAGSRARRKRTRTGTLPRVYEMDVIAMESGASSNTYAAVI